MIKSKIIFTMKIKIAIIIEIIKTHAINPRTITTIKKIKTIGKIRTVTPNETMNENADHIICINEFNSFIIVKLYH